MTALFPNKFIKRNVNSRLCPIHHCSLEGSPYLNEMMTTIVLRCCFEPRHYFLTLQWFDADNPQVEVISERLTIDDKSLHYTISVFYAFGRPFKTDIIHIQIDGNGDVIEGAEINVNSIDNGTIFDFTSSKEQIIKKLRLYTLIS